MKIKNKSAKMKNLQLLLIASCVFLILCGVTAFFIFNQKRQVPAITQSSGDTINYGPPTDAEIKDGERVKIDKKNNSNTKESLSNDNSSGIADQDSKIPISITATNQSNSTLQIRTLIEKITSRGTCKLTMVRGDRSLSKITNVQVLANASTCAGFDVPLNELSSGVWAINIVYDDNGLRASVKGQVEIK